MSNSNHDPKNKECLLNHLDPICFPSGNVRPVLHIEHDMNGKKFVCPYSVCTCPPEQKQEWEIQFDEQSPLAFDGRKWAKQFCRTQISLAEERVRRESFSIIEKLSSFYGNPRKEKMVYLNDVIKELSNITQKS